MSPVFAARRRAEEFDALVQRGSERPGPGHARYAELLEVAGALRAVPAPEPRPEFAASLRERLMAAAASELAAVERPDRSRPSVEDRLTLTPRRTSRERRIAIAVGGFAVVGASTSMAVASQSALPGDTLYPIKRAIENAHIGVSVGDEQKGSTLLDNARARLREATELASETPERQDTEAIRDTLDDFGAQAGEASTLLLGDVSDGDRAAVETLQAFTAEGLASLEELSDRVSDDDARDALVDAGNVLLGIDLELQQACPDCPDSLTQIPQWLITQASGPIGTTAPPAADPSPPREDRGGRGTDGDQDAPGQGDEDDAEYRPVLPTDIPSGLPGVGGPPTPAPGSGGGSGSGGTGEGGAKDPKKGPVGNLIEGITGGKDNPIPVVPELLAGVGDLLDGLTGPLLGGLTGKDPDQK
ncbi:hypothetical protein GHK92_01085 [Nocardioides sp. dk4132]|uniref:DUF5667 domain-containing protein n=1 Tax=unclassified Nocardioides TaxID=2615069 RepID=UPI001296580B|nr:MULTISPECIES: DUF5667 domain-containing protein [unclassified Nocardioides]MQW74461.1 hypothetical protein [Nocardioides sp. dk4132]QGA06394.1 hypothetical protein GFH29_02530 [Nocardioides sp. dk884]